MKRTDRIDARAGGHKTPFSPAISIAPLSIFKNFSFYPPPPPAENQQVTLFSLFRNDRRALADALAYSYTYIYI
jgi:hypothetical protein